MRDDFSMAVKEALAKRVGHRCSNPACRQPTSGPAVETTGTINVGVAAHITAAAEGGPRYAQALSAEARRSIENGIWLCQKCAKLIDSDTGRYSSEILRTWRLLAEQVALAELEIRPGTVAASSDSRFHSPIDFDHKAVSINASSSGPGDANVATGDIVLGNKYSSPDERVMLLKEARKEIGTIDTSMLADVFLPGSDVLAAFNRFLPGAALALQVYDRVRSLLEEERAARLDIYLAKHEEFQMEILLNAEKYTPEALEAEKQSAAQMLVKDVGNLWQFIEALKRELSEQIRELV